MRRGAELAEAKEVMAAKETAAAATQVAKMGSGEATRAAATNEAVARAMDVVAAIALEVPRVGMSAVAMVVAARVAAGSVGVLAAKAGARAAA